METILIFRKRQYIAERLIGHPFLLWGLYVSVLMWIFTMSQHEVAVRYWIPLL
jgi:hypothetical protein